MQVITEQQTTRTPASKKLWWRGAVIYQIYVRSFCDSTGDGIGDLPGITSKLDYVAGLGVDGIWLTPFFQSPHKDMGYDVSDYCAVDPLFGSMADFDELQQKAHALGLKVIIDQVLSHTSDQHEWFRLSSSNRDNEKADWFVWADPRADGGPPNNWLSVFGGSAWTWWPSREQYYMHNFLDSQPDLNFHNLQVQDAHLNNIDFWVRKGVDGFRLDTVNFYFHDQQLRDNPMLTVDPLHQSIPEFNPYGLQDHVYDKNRPENLDFLQRVRERLDQYGELTTIGELGEDGEKCLQLIEQYTGSGKRLHMCYGFEMLSGNFSTEKLVQYSRRLESNTEQAWICNAFSNHDVMRAISRWTFEPQYHRAVAVLALNLLLALRGSAYLYQGEELGIPQSELAYEDLRDPYGIAFWPKIPSRDGCRTPMPWDSKAEYAGFGGARPWLPIDPRHLPLAVDRQTGDPGSILTAFRRWLAFRKQNPALIDGDMRLVENEYGLLVLAREMRGQRLLAVFNLEAIDKEYPLPASWGSRAVEGEHIQVNGQSAVFGPYGFGYLLIDAAE